MPARLLVGPNSVDSANAASDFVAAPLVQLKASAGSVPGFAANATPVIGGYAWWVSDESTKAKINLRNSCLSQTSVADQTAFQRYSFITSQRSGIDRMDQVLTPTANGGAAADVLDTAYPAMNSAAILAKAISPRQLPLVGSDSAAQTKLTSALKLRFHDLTDYGSGVLADAYAGGLKKDLTADIANITTSASGNRPGDGDTLFPKQKSTDHVPTWGLLRSFPRTQPDASGAMDPVAPLMNASGDYIGGGVSPVINFANFGLDFYLDNNGNIQVAMFPMVILWNPHATQLNPSDYEIGYHFSTIGGGTEHCRYFIETSATAGGAMSPVATLDLRGGDLVAGGTGVNNPGFVRFKIKGEAMAPGEAQVYVLGSSGSVYSPGANTLVRGASPITNYVSWTIPAMGITATMYANGEMQARTVAPAGRHAMNVVLAKPGALASWDGTSIGTNWYQAVMDANAFSRGGAGYWLYPFPRTRFNSSSLGSSSTGATTTMYASAIMEGRGGFNSSATFIGAMGTGGGQGGRYRWLVTGNPRAPVLRNTKVENAGFVRGNVVFGTMELFTKLGGNTGATGRDPFFPYNGWTSGYNTKIGGSQDNGELRAVLFDVLQDPSLLLSVGQLQHAAFGTYGFYPTYSFGNSWADVRIPSEQQYLANTFSPTFSTSVAAAANTETLYDLSWHLNRALWDRYFVSGVPSSWASADVTSGRALPNARMAYYRPNGVAPGIDDLRYSAAGGAAYDKASANLLVDGAFNVNSTSEQAWRSLLGSTLGLLDNAAYATPGAASSGDSVGTVAAIPRFSGNQAQTGYTSTMGSKGGWYLGNRGLMTNAAGTTDELTRLVNELARSIVVEIKARGPFLSLADFVNRRLVAADAVTGIADPNGVRGALQAAIDKMGYTSASPVKGNTAVSAPLSAGDIPKSGWPASGWNPDHFLGAPVATNTGESSTRSAACPKFLTQADLLSLLGPALTVRGDTFAIRTYGEVRNPATNNIDARAWCEAIVQRLPDYVVSGDPAETAPSALTQGDNRTFGRRYRIVSMRWLSPSDI